MPRRYSVAAGALGSTGGLVLSTVHGLDHVTKVGIFLLVSVLPPWLLEMRWKQKHRRESEELLVLPGSDRDGARRAS